MAKILIATEKPFASVAVDGIKKIFQEAGFETLLLEKYTDKKQLLEAVVDVDGIIVRSDKVDKEVFDAARSLKIVVRAGAGYDNVDLAEATAHSVCVMNTPGQNSNAVAELAVGLMIFASRNHFNGKSGKELKDKKLGIVAYGNIGRNLARIANGFDMTLCYNKRNRLDEKEEKEFNLTYASIKDIFASCDIVSLHTPANDQTKKSIGYDLIKSMPKGAMIINTARKEIIDEDGLLKALKERDDINYLTDIAADNSEELKEIAGERYFATPKKMGAQTGEANANAGFAAAHQIVRFIKEGNETFRVNK